MRVPKQTLSHFKFFLHTVEGFIKTTRWQSLQKIDLFSPYHRENSKIVDSQRGLAHLLLGMTYSYYLDTEDLKVFQQKLPVAIL